MSFCLEIKGHEASGKTLFMDKVKEALKDEYEINQATDDFYIVKLKENK